MWQYEELIEYGSTKQLTSGIADGQLDVPIAFANMSIIK